MIKKWFACVTRLQKWQDCGDKRVRTYVLFEDDQSYIHMFLQLAISETVQLPILLTTLKSTLLIMLRNQYFVTSLQNIWMMIC